MEWINVKDKVPENNDVEVLVKHKNYNHYFMATYYDIGGRWWFRKEIGHVETNEITHWMPLPPPPKSDNSVNGLTAKKSNIKVTMDKE